MPCSFSDYGLPLASASQPIDWLAYIVCGCLGAPMTKVLYVSNWTPQTAPGGAKESTLLRPHPGVQQTEALNQLRCWGVYHSLVHSLRNTPAGAGEWKRGPTVDPIYWTVKADEKKVVRHSTVNRLLLSLVSLLLLGDCCVYPKCIDWGASSRDSREWSRGVDTP